MHISESKLRHILSTVADKIYIEAVSLFNTISSNSLNKLNFDRNDTSVYPWLFVVLSLFLCNGCVSVRAVGFETVDGKVTECRDSVKGRLENIQVVAEYLEEEFGEDRAIQYVITNLDEPKQELKGILPLGKFRAEIGSVRDNTKLQHLDYLFLESFTMGAHCCWYYHVIGLSPNIHFVGQLLSSTGEIALEDVDGDGSPEIAISDDVYTFWGGTGYADSIYSSVYLKISGDAISLDTKAMSEPVPSPSDFDQSVAEARDAFDKGEVQGFDISYDGKEFISAPMPMVQEVIRLIYGRVDEYRNQLASRAGLIVEHDLLRRRLRLPSCRDFSEGM